MSAEALARTTDPATSRAAAEFVSSTLSERKREVMELLDRYPDGLTTDEMSLYGDLRLVSISPRMIQLEQDGLVIRAGTRKNPNTNRPATVWKAAAGEVQPTRTNRTYAALIRAIKAAGADAKDADTDTDRDRYTGIRERLIELANEAAGPKQPVEPVHLGPPTEADLDATLTELHSPASPSRDESAEPPWPPPWTGKRDQEPDYGDNLFDTQE